MGDELLLCYWIAIGWLTLEHPAEGDAVLLVHLLIEVIAQLEEKLQLLLKCCLGHGVTNHHQEEVVVVGLELGDFEHQEGLDFPICDVLKHFCVHHHDVLDAVANYLFKEELSYPLGICLVNPEDILGQLIHFEHVSLSQRMRPWVQLRLTVEEITFEFLHYLRNGRDKSYFL